ncbi:MAG: helix-turn-helix domain-containing protein [Opitutales bacterium]|nr:helix-turn-helix domain-containing protein [Opitutales bacterium]
MNAIGARVIEGALICAQEKECPWMVETVGPDAKYAIRMGDCLGLCGLFNKEVAESSALRETSFPVINVSNRWGVLAGVGNFLSDDEAIGGEAAAHLLERGYRHFMIVGELQQKKFVKERIDGFRARLGGLAASCEIVTRDFFTALHAQTMPSFIRETEEELHPVFQRLPMDVAVFASNDWLAGLVQRVLLEHYPERVHTTAVLGVDDEQHTWWYLGPLAGLSSVRPAFHAMGAAAMEWMMEHPGDREAILREKTRRFAPERVVMRASTAGGACADPMTARMIRWAWQAMQEGNKVQVSDLALQFHMSRRTLDRKFSQHLGMGAGDYLRTQRLDMAVHLLRSTEMTIAEISQRCGYTKQDTLSTVFRREFDKTPMEFRREARKEK